MPINDFESLLESLPMCDPFPTASPLPNGIRRVANAVPNYIPAALAHVTSPDSDGPDQILIISAPGAVGKTTLAAELAHRRKSLLWDLASASEIAANSLQGILHATLEPGQLDDYLEYLEAGLQFLVIDALDEGRAKVNENSFRRFLEDVASLGQRSAGPSFVLFGRTDIAETTWFVLSEQGANVRMLSMSAFNRQQANDYIDHHLHPIQLTVPLRQCRDLIFDNLAFSVSGDNDSDVSSDFLHYPPVLDVIATLLKEESNPQRLKNDLTESASNYEKEAIHLLNTVMDRIMLREQEKLLPAIRHALESHAAASQWSDWPTLYTNDEQAKRILGRVLDEPIDSTPAGLPPQLHARYQDSEALATGVPEHPFLQGVDRFANRVFESYLYARALHGEFGQGAANAVGTRLASRTYLPTRLLAAFYLAKASEDGTTPRSIAPEHLGIVYDSLVSDDSTHSLVRLTVDGSDPATGEDEGPLEAEVDFELIRFDDAGAVIEPLQEPIAFVMPLSTESNIRFTTSLREAHITVPCTVTLGNSEGDFTATPGVYIAARSLVLDTEELIVKGRSSRTVEDGDDLVVLEARQFDGHVTAPRVRVYPGGRLAVDWPSDEQYPWHEYATPAVSATTDHSEDVEKAYMRFRRIATTFRSHGKVALARTRYKVEHQRVLQGDLGQALLARLTQDDVLTLDEEGKRYFWNAERADTLLGVSWQDLRTGQMPARLSEYLASFVQQQ